MCREIPLHHKKTETHVPIVPEGWFFHQSKSLSIPDSSAEVAVFLVLLSGFGLFLRCFSCNSTGTSHTNPSRVLSQDGQIVACLDIQQHKAYQSHPFCKTGKSSITWHAEQLPLSPLSSSFSAAGSPPHTGFIGMELIEFGPNSLPFESDWPHWQEPEGPAWAAITRPCQPQKSLLPAFTTFTTYILYGALCTQNFFETSNRPCSLAYTLIYQIRTHSWRIYYSLHTKIAEQPGHFNIRNQWTATFPTKVGIPDTAANAHGPQLVYQAEKKRQQTWHPRTSRATLIKLSAWCVRQSI